MVDETPYFVEDEHCPNPECDCQEVHLVFLRDTGKTLEHDFTVQWGLDDRIAAVDPATTDRDRVRGHLEVLRRSEGGDVDLLVDLTSRYAEIKAIGARILEEHFSPPMSPARHERKRRKKIGRNEPCPCGSGKEYKRCCLPTERR